MGVSASPVVGAVVKRSEPMCDGRVPVPKRPLDAGVVVVAGAVAVEPKRSFRKVLGGLGFFDFCNDVWTEILEKFA